MATDNTTLNLGTGGDVIVTEALPSGAKLPVSKIRTGGQDMDGGDVEYDNPLAVTESRQREPIDRAAFLTLDQRSFASATRSSAERVTLSDRRGGDGARGAQR